MDGARVRAQAAELAARVEPEVNKLAREMVERRFAEIPGYDRLPGDMRDLEIAATARHALRRFLRSRQGDLDTRDLDPLLERAAQRAQEGVGLVTLLRSYHLGSQVLLDALTAAALPGEEAALLLVMRRQHRVLAATVEAVTEAYLAGLSERQEAAQELARALLHGHEPHAVATRCGLRLLPHYRVLHVRVPQATAAVAARRLLGRIRSRLEGLAEDPVLMARDEHGGHLLLSGGVTTAQLARHLTGEFPAAELPSIGVALAERPEQVPRAAEQARRISQLADEPGLHELTDVLLDYHLGRPSEAAAEITAALAPLDGHPNLTETLAAYLAHDLDRRATATALRVHPNTVDNRLARITELTGIDPRTTQGVMLCGVGFALRRRQPS